MTNKNTFRFATFAAVASLGLGLMISGCGDSGSTTPNPLNAEYGQVTFNYNVLAAKVATPVAKEIVTVKYAFFGVKTGGARFIDGPSVAYTHDFIHGDKDQEEIVKINNVDLDASGVIATYYDKDGNIVAMGQDIIAFNADRKCAIEEPDLATIDTTTIDMDASTHVLSPKGETEISITADGKTAAGVVKTYELTPFVTIEGLDKYTDVLAFNYASNQGLTYEGVGYDGINKGIVPGKTINATINGTNYCVDEDIYVTDQHPVDIEVVVDDIDGVYPFFVGAAKVPLIFADKESLVAGKNIIDMSEAGTTTVEHVAVNKLPFEVHAAAYSNDADKGPQPVLPNGSAAFDISDFTGLKLVSSSPDVAEVAGLGVTAKRAGSTVISAELKIDETATIKSDSSKDITVAVLPTTENLAFANIGGTYPKFMEDITVNDVGAQYFTMAIYGKVGMTFDTKDYVAAPIEYTAETYPDVEALDSSLTDSIYRKIADKNEYELHVGTTAPSAAVPVTVKDAASLKPAFVPINIKP